MQVPVTSSPPSITLLGKVHAFYSLTPSLKGRVPAMIFSLEEKCCPTLPRELVQYHIIPQTVPEYFDGTIESLFQKNRTVASLGELFAQMGFTVSDTNIKLVLNLISQTGFDLSEEFSTIRDMHNHTNGKNVSQKEGQNHFDYQYGVTDLERFISLIIDFKELPSSISKTFVTRFVTEEYMDLYNHIEADKTITDLDLSRKDLSRLPKNIRLLTNLTTLNLSRNKFIVLPESILGLINLTTLNLFYNNLETLPECISALKNLKILNLRANELKTLRESISALKNLKTLDLWHNPIANNLKEIERIRGLLPKGVEINISK